MTHEKLKKRALSVKSVKKAYDGMETEYRLLREMLLARKSSGLTQAEVAERMGTKPTAVTRIESSLQSGKHSPSIATLKKYAGAMGYEVEIKFVKEKESPYSSE